MQRRNHYPFHGLAWSNHGEGRNRRRQLVAGRRGESDPWQRKDEDEGENETSNSAATLKSSPNGTKIVNPNYSFQTNWAITRSKHTKPKMSFNEYTPPGFCFKSRLGQHNSKGAHPFFFTNIFPYPFFFCFN